MHLHEIGIVNVFEEIWKFEISQCQNNKGLQHF